MWSFLANVGYAILGMLWPLGKSGRWWPALTWTLHVLLVVLILVGLVFLNRAYRLHDWFDSPFLIVYFWPLLFVLLYFILLCGWWLWKLLAFEQETSYFPDIDAAWKEGMYALAQAGIRLPEVPVYLILGRPESGERNLIEAARLNLVVRQTPQDPRAPVHIYADRDAVYVTCVGASLLGRQAGILALEEMGQQETTQEGASEPEIDITKTIIPTGKKESQLVEELDDSEFGELTTLERRRLRRHIGKALGPDFLSDPYEVRRLSERLTHLCKLIARDRLPFCPINGVLLLVPLGGADTDVDAQQTSEACRIDLDTVHVAFDMHFPVVTMVCDMEVLPGFREFLRRQDANNLLRRLGQRYPLATNLSLNDNLEQMRQSIQWLCNDFIQESIYKYFQIEEGDGSPGATIPPGNWALFLLLDEMRNRANRLSAIVTQTFGRHSDGPLMFGGCYLGATGNRGEQAFVHGLFDRMIKEQNSVAWTARALDKDASLHAQSRLGFSLLTLGWIVVPLVLGWLLWLKWRG